MDKAHVYMCSHIASIESIFPSPFLISIGRFLILAEAFRNEYVAACSMLSAVLLRREWFGWLRNRSVSVENDTA